MWIIICIVVVALIYLYCIAPNTGRKENMKPFTEVYIAHRGLFDNGDGEWKAENDKKNDDGMPGTGNIEIIPENSIPAFERAVAAGYGIELDTQTTADGRLVVFHDESLYRMCGVNKKLYECTYEELQHYGLAGTDYKIPLFDDVLKMVDGRVPLIVEVKSEGNWRRTTRMTAESLDAYGMNTRYNAEASDFSERTEQDKTSDYKADSKDGSGIYAGRSWAYCVESFHPLVLKWFRSNRPQVLRGQLSTNFFKSSLKMTWIANILLTNLMLDFLSRPDFIAYNYKYKNDPTFRLCRHLFKVVSAAWTVRSEEVLRKVEKVFDIIIFDSFVPER